MQFTPKELTPDQMCSLRDFLERVPDPRHRRGRRYPWPTLLTIVLAARIASATARFILDHGLHYLLTVKGNQLTIRAQLRDDYHWTAVAHAETGLGHGRIERRTIQATP